jgi:ligand-binding sensor domain-containing protein
MRVSVSATTGRRGGAWRGIAAGVLVAAAALLLASCATAVTGEWQTLNMPSSENTLTLAQDPTSTQLIYAGGTGGVVYRDIAGKTVVPVPGVGIPQGAVVTALAANPAAKGTIYAATSEGLYFSTDYGDHWSARGRGFPTGDTMDALVYAPSQRTLFSGSTAHGVYVSQDQGQTWQPAGGGLPANANIDTLFWEQATQSIYASVDGVGLFVSTDGGASWSARDAGLPQQAFALLELADHGLSASGPTLYAGTNKGVYASTDGGQHWSATSIGLPSGRVLTLAADAAAQASLYAGTDMTVYHSSDGGRTWTLLAPGLNHQIASLLVMRDTAGHVIVFAGAGQLARYPPLVQSGASAETVILNVIMLALIVAAGFFIFQRSRRQMRAIELNARFAMRSRVAGAGDTELVQPREPARSAPQESTNGSRPRAKVTRPTTPVRPPDQAQSKGDGSDGSSNGHGEGQPPTG